MGIGIGIVLLAIGLVLVLDAVDLPAGVHDVIATETFGWICVALGALALVLGLVQSALRSRATRIEHRHNHEV